MIANVNNNRCGCSVISVNQCSPTPTNDKCCLVLCNLLAKKETYPCNNTKTIDLTSYIKIPSCCTRAGIPAPEFSIPYHTNNLKDVEILTQIEDPGPNGGVSKTTYWLTYTSNYSEGKDYKSAEIVYQASCNQLINQATVIIPFKQINPLYNCSYKYDPCTGDCIEEPGDILIIDNPSSQISIT
jgi:hypothetical protein